MRVGRDKKTSFRAIKKPRGFQMAKKEHRKDIMGLVYNKCSKFVIPQDSIKIVLIESANRWKSI